MLRQILLLAILSLARLRAQSIVLDVDVKGRTAQLSYEPTTQTAEEAARAFCELHGIDESFISTLSGELDRIEKSGENVKTSPKPPLEVAVSLNGNDVYVYHRAGIDSAEETAMAFAAEHNLTAEDVRPLIARLEQLSHDALQPSEPEAFVMEMTILLDGESRRIGLRKGQTAETAAAGYAVLWQLDADNTAALAGALEAASRNMPEPFDEEKMLREESARLAKEAEAQENLRREIEAARIERVRAEARATTAALRATAAEVMASPPAERTGKVLVDLLANNEKAPLVFDYVDGSLSTREAATHWCMLFGVSNTEDIDMIDNAIQTAVKREETLVTERALAATILKEAEIAAAAKQAQQQETEHAHAKAPQSEGSTDKLDIDSTGTFSRAEIPHDDAQEEKKEGENNKGGLFIWGSSVGAAAVIAKMLKAKVFGGGAKHRGAPPKARRRSSIARLWGSLSNKLQKKEKAADDVDNKREKDQEETTKRRRKSVTNNDNNAAGDSKTQGNAGVAAAVNGQSDGVEQGRSFSSNANASAAFTWEAYLEKAASEGPFAKIAVIDTSGKLLASTGGFPGATETHELCDLARLTKSKKTDVELGGCKLLVTQRDDPMLLTEKSGTLRIVVERVKGALLCAAFYSGELTNGDAKGAIENMAEDIVKAPK